MCSFRLGSTLLSNYTRVAFIHSNALSGDEQRGLRSRHPISLRCLGESLLMVQRPLILDIRCDRVRRTLLGSVREVGRGLS